MTGNNELRLNEGTLMEIIGRWMVMEMPDIAFRQQVTGVSRKDDVFVVRLAGKEPVGLGHGN